MQHPIPFNLSLRHQSLLHTILEIHKYTTYPYPNPHSPKILNLSAICSFPPFFPHLSPQSLPFSVHLEQFHMIYGCTLLIHLAALPFGSYPLPFILPPSRKKILFSFPLPEQPFSSLRDGAARSVLDHNDQNHRFSIVLSQVSITFNYNTAPLCAGTA